ncbi:VRR-NUC domain-containing protein [Paenarthrobacter nitroguajacolicus]|uniref:VRR-NUC domain-containing protein n=1 Tax=Paenarthrobacter nitroguajacolicus TaxID=211146 RepID=UPI0015B88E79|nr:VRR-NUC domain-containing protein [Paenarthrobacter nitroguajacolicus]NWL32962.1 VRR-NUC domain-containing protein [Paenarthrobacter nitroguajacolicus]
MPTQRLSSPNSPSEDEFQSAVLQLAQLLGYQLRYHNPDSRRSQAGFPDLVLGSSSRKRLLFRELKTDTGRVSPAQRVCMEILNLAGANAAVWRPQDLRSGRIERELRGDK